ncbi:MAG TPA: NAD-dependent protein deacetylase [Polyangiaceae bacterium]|nr:NAD-dependent protein deacetylase [Polyangiaceae bacterium]
MSDAAEGDRSEAALGVGRLSGVLGEHRRWFVLTGAGCSTQSGIPAYRDETGAWRHKAPIQLREFLHSEAVRRRYWARSFVGFERVHRAEPNRAHRALARFEQLGRARLLVTQNVDGLHQKAGSVGVVDLHGQLAEVECLDCRSRQPRAGLQQRLLEQNPWLVSARSDGATPDGDAEIDVAACDGLTVPSCERCGGVLKPAVVFFGENVPKARIDAAYAALAESDAVLVVGSSLMVFSGYRFARRAAELAKPVVILNNGLTRADTIAALKLQGDCGQLLGAAMIRLEEGR